MTLRGRYTVVDNPAEPGADQIAAVAKLLGREPEGDFRVKVSDTASAPVVIQNAPFTTNGRPMPTRYWLVDAQLCRAVSRLEGSGAVREAERSVSEQDLVALHCRYAQERDALVEPGHTGPLPTGGVGGTRKGVKCLHAHLAHYLATGEDVVGDWAARQLAEQGLV